MATSIDPGPVLVVGAENTVPPHKGGGEVPIHRVVVVIVMEGPAVDRKDVIEVPWEVIT